MSNAMIGYDTRFAIESAPGSGVYVELDEVYDVTPPSATIGEIDVTHNKSPNRRREYIPALTESGSAGLQMNFVPGSATDMRIEQLRASAQVLSMRITYPNGVTVTFDGFVKEYTPAVPVDDRMTATASLTVTGDVVVSAAVAPVNGIPPYITGTAKVGQRLSVWPGIWSGGGEITYQWRVGGTPVAGATGETYTPVSGNVGSPVTVSVTATNSAGSATVVSPATANVVS